MPKQDEVKPEVKNTIQWLISELWEALVLSSIGSSDLIEDRLLKVITFLKSQGITETTMALEDEMSDESIKKLLEQFKKLD